MLSHLLGIERWRLPTQYNPLVSKVDFDTHLTAEPHAKRAFNLMLRGD